MESREGMGGEVSLYTDRAHELNLKAIINYLEKNTKFRFIDAGDFFERWGYPKDFSEKLASIRIADFQRRGMLTGKPTKEEIAREAEALASRAPIPFVPERIYEGFALEALFRSLIRAQGFHIVFTSRMLSTWGGGRCHGRTIICGYPIALISTTGLVEAPARPRLYYAKLLGRERAERMGLEVPTPEEFKIDLNREFGGAMLDYDERLTEVCKGYALQALGFFLTFEAFCGDRDCRLYNAHTQEELIHAQLESGRICDRHKQVLKR